MTLADGTTQNLRSIAARKPLLLLAVSPTCASCQPVIGKVDTYRRLMPELDVRFLLSYPPGRQPLIERDEPQSLHDPEGYVRGLDRRLGDADRGAARGGRLARRRARDRCRRDRSLLRRRLREPARRATRSRAEAGRDTEHGVVHGPRSSAMRAVAQLDFPWVTLGDFTGDRRLRCHDWDVDPYRGGR